MNWGSLLFGSLANFVIPFFLFFVSKRHRALSLPSSAESYYSFILLIADLVEGDRISLRTLHSVSRRVSSIDRTPSETASPSHVHVPSPPATIIITNVDEPLRDFDEELGDIKLKEPEVNDQNGSSTLRLNTSVVSVYHTSEIDGQAKASGGLTPIDNFTDIPDHQSPPTSQIKRRRGHSRGEESVISERGSVSDSPPSIPADDELDHDGTQLSLRSIRSETLNSASSRRGSNHSRTNTESQNSTEALFHAIPESKWVRPVILAIVGFVVMTVMVLGNIIYTYRSCYEIS